MFVFCSLAILNTFSLARTAIFSDLGSHLSSLPSPVYARKSKPRAPEIPGAARAPSTARPGRRRYVLRRFRRAAATWLRPGLGRMLYFPQAKGKTIEDVEFSTSPDDHSISTSFQDKTSLNFSIETGFTVETDYSDWKTGEQRVLRTLGADTRLGIRGRSSTARRGRRDRSAASWLRRRTTLSRKEPQGFSAFPASRGCLEMTKGRSGKPGIPRNDEV